MGKVAYMKRVHTIYAFYETETEAMLKKLEGMGVDVSKCFVCGVPIVKAERVPRFLWEKWDAWRHKKKFYDWNISGICKRGVICDNLLCFSKANRIMRDEINA